ncbi:MAG: PAS domain S-box protein [Candidatus Scalindua sp.]
MRLTIGRKLSIGFTIVLVIMIAMGVNSYISLSKIKRSTDTVAQYAQEMKEVSKLRFPLIEALIVNDYLVSGEVEKKGHFEEVSRIVGEVIHDAKSFAFSEEKKRFLMEIDKNFGLVRKKSHEILKFADFAKEGFTGIRSNKIIEEIDAAAAIVVDNIESLDELVRRDLAQEIIRSERIKLTGIWIIIISSVVAIVIGIIAWLVLTHSITSPIRSLISATSIMAKGDLTQRADVKSSDEIGELADSFNKMTIDLRKFRDDLKQSEERYRGLIENSSEIIYQTDQKRFFAGMNNTMLVKLGFRSEELMGMKIEHIVPANEREKVIDHIRKVIEEGSDSIETMFLSKQGKIIYVEINANAMYDAENNFIQTRAFVRDITERKKAEEAEKHGKNLQLLSSQIISIQEKERRRISRELHDDTGQALTAMKINIEMMENNIPGSSTNIRKKLAETKQLVTHTLHEIRSLAFDLRPSLLDHFGALAAISEYSKNYSERTNINVQVRGENIVERFSPEIDILLYRCAQEALNNVTKHSEATNVTIEIVQEEQEIRMRINDNGKGFDIKEPFGENMNGSGIGLFGMKERVSLLNGSLRIHSEENKGFEIEILVPFIKTNNENSFSGVAKNV